MNIMVVGADGTVRTPRLTGTILEGSTRGAIITLLADAGREVVEAVAALGAPRVVMAACDPAAGARDLGLFMRTGYRIAAMSALDMFPHTHHFETVCVLERE